MKFRNKVQKFFAKKTVAATSVFGAGSLMAAVPTFAATADESVDFTGTSLPFTVPGMLTTAVNFLSMYGAWIALALGVLFAPVLYGLAMKLVNTVRAKTAKT